MRFCFCKREMYQFAGISETLLIDDINKLWQQVYGYYFSLFFLGMATRGYRTSILFRIREYTRISVLSNYLSSFTHFRFRRIFKIFILITYTHLPEFFRNNFCLVSYQHICIKIYISFFKKQIKLKLKSWIIFWIF